MLKAINVTDNSFMKICKRGRPPIFKTEEELKEHTRKRNRINKRKSRNKSKLKQKIHSNANNDFNSKYQNDLIEYHMGYEYDYFFTGTISQNIRKKDFEECDYQLLKEFNHFFEIPNKDFFMSIESLSNYIKKYLEFLKTRNPYTRCFATYETDASGAYHVHMIFKSSPNHINFNKASEKSWLIGVQKITIPVVEDKRDILNYMVKQLKPLSSKRSDQKKIDNWIMDGVF